MPLWEIGVVLASLSMVVIAIVAVRVMRSVERSVAHVTRLSEDIRQWVGQATALTTEARETVASVRDVVAPIRRAVDRFEELGARAARLSTVVLEEVEAPMFRAALIVRRLSAVAAALVSWLPRRNTRGRAATLGGPTDE